MFYSFFFHFLVFVFGLIHLHYILPTDLSFMFSLFCLILVVHFSLPRFFFLSCHYFPLFAFLVRPQFYLKNSLLTASFVSSKNQQKRKFSSKLSKKNQAKLKHYYISYKVYGNLHIFSNVSIEISENTQISLCYFTALSFYFVI